MQTKSILHAITKVKNLFSDRMAMHIDEYDSKYSGTIFVHHGPGYRYIVTGTSVTQSGSLISTLWTPVLRKVGKRNKTWLILGVAGGTLASEISKKYAPKKITGVEIDPVMIDIGKKIFSTDKIDKLEIVHADAAKYIQTQGLHFDYVLVDMYCGDQLPDFVNSEKFMAQTKAIGDIVVFNHLFYGKKRLAAEVFVKKVEKVFSSVELVRKLANLLVICH